MIKIKNFTKNTVHSFILLPLLLSNVAVTPVDEVSKTSIIPEAIGENISLNFQIFKQEIAPAPLDTRAEKIDAYFAQWDLPMSGYGADLVAAADMYGIDWRLLPALAMLETTGGKHTCKNANGMNNFFGYGSCKIKFARPEDSFYAVAKTLSGNGEKTAHLYKDKSVEEILEVYNPPGTPGMTPNYHGKALKIMNDIQDMDVNTNILAKA